MSESLVEVVHVFWETSHSGLVILSSDWDVSDQALPLAFGPDRNVPQSFQSLAEEAGRYCRYFRKKKQGVSNPVGAISTASFRRCEGLFGRDLINGRKPSGKVPGNSSRLL